MSRFFRPTKAIVDLSAFEHNLRWIQSTLKSQQQFFCPMIKSNGYGHSDLELARVCEKVGVSGVGVALLEEALGLRASGYRGTIFMYGPLPPAYVVHLLDHSVTPVIGQWPELEALAQLTRSRATPFSVHIKINTGMNRLGFAVEDVARLRDFLSQHNQLKLTGVCTHLACGDDAKDLRGVTHRQIQIFRVQLDYFAQWKPVIHIWNSPGWFSVQSASHVSDVEKSWGVRPGLAIYGVQPLPNLNLPIKPVMSLVSKIVTLQRVKKGDSVSYGARWKADRDSLIGVVPIGYADGYSRAFSNKGVMLVDGKKVPIVGIVCMDYTMVDLTDVATPGSQDLEKEVTILGSQGDQILSAEGLAQVINTIPYEIITSIGSRVPREFKDH